MLNRGVSLILLLGVSTLAAGRGESALQESTSAFRIAVLLTALSLLPALFVSVTPFLRISLVLHFLRQAMGVQSAPSNQVLNGLALFLSLLLVQPIGMEIYQQAWTPWDEGKITGEAAIEAAAAPLRKWMLRFTREKDIRLTLQISGEKPPASAQAVSLRHLIPAYVLSELRAGFQIGAILYLPFLMIDLIAAGVTLSIGMMQLPPAMVSTPFKLLIFVLADGWNLVVGSLMKSFLTGGAG
jgi:flagellar biosynthesis protein FliP